MPYNVLSKDFKNKIWLMYLRKSRQDDPNETVEEVLAKHEAILQEWAVRELGGMIPEDCIFREVVSGESISERKKIQQLLSMVESPTVAGVVCVDPQRLSRGDLLDCGTLINTLMYTSTLVATPVMTYDLTNKMERRFFQDELMRGRDYYDYVREVMNRGRIAAAKKGCFIGSTPPFGYDKVTIGKDHTLVPNKDAEVVRMIFDWYVNERVGYTTICNRLDDMGVKPVFTDRWLKNTIGEMLRNVQYDGKICYNRKKSVVVMKDGEKRVSRPRAKEEDMIIVEGKHPAIVDHDLFMAAQAIINNNPRVTSERELKNAFAGLLTCVGCGRGLYLNGYGGRTDARIECRHKPKHFKSVKYKELEAAVTSALEQSELPNLEAMMKNNAGSSASIQQQILKRLETEMQEYHDQEEMQYELLETKRYTQELFEKRNAALRQKMRDCEARIKKARQALPNAIDYEERTTCLKEAIKAMKDSSITPEEKNRFLKAIIENIEVQTVDGGVGVTELHLKIFLKI